MTTSQHVDTEMGLIKFGGVEIPYGFLRSFRDPKHGFCKPLDGIRIVNRLGGQRFKKICDCAINRAISYIRIHNKTSFSDLSKKWLAAREEFILELENTWRGQGKEAYEAAKPEAASPYNVDSHNHTIWLEGYIEAKIAKEGETPDSSHRPPPSAPSPSPTTPSPETP